MAQRIIGGSLKGKRLCPVSGRRIRPTGDRQRESIFNIISPVIPGAVVLDLFAGTGALGLEALSRGAQCAVLIDVQGPALAVIERNIRGCRLEDRTRTIRWDIEKNLNCLKGIGRCYDLVFMDPPYGFNCIAPALANLHQSGALKKGALVVVEHSREEPIPQSDLPYACSDQRRYGKTLVSFLNYMV